MAGNNILDPKGMPPCMRGCIYFREITLLDGSKLPKCLMQLMVLTVTNENQLFINVLQCPDYTTPDQLKAAGESKEQLIKP